MSDSNTKTTSVCPSHNSHMEAGQPRYLRVSFFVTYNGMSPNKEKFYFHEHPINLSLTSIAKMNAEALALLQANGRPHALHAEFEDWVGVTVNEEEMKTIEPFFVINSAKTETV